MPKKNISAILHPTLDEYDAVMLTKSGTVAAPSKYLIQDQAIINETFKRVNELIHSVVDFEGQKF